MEARVSLPHILHSQVSHFKRPVRASMKLKHVEAELSRLHSSLAFPSPNVALEQYPTSPHLAAHLAWSAMNLGDIVEDKDSDEEGEEGGSAGAAGTRLLDLGCGTGILGISAVVVGASCVTALDCDSAALSVARSNVELMEMEGNFTFVEAKLEHKRGGGGGGGGAVEDGLPFEDNSFDVVFTNPPFGTKNNAGIDVAFLKAAVRVASRAVYSFHKSSTRAYLMKKCKEWGCTATVLAEMKFEVKKIYKFHKKDAVDVAVDLIRVELSEGG